jgi:dTDP-4-dehydrorhamnose 3,5-epimerase
MNKKKINFPTLFDFFESKDVRGSFCKIFNNKIEKKFNFKIKEINFSFNKRKGTLRGLHYQDLPKNEDKFVCCMKGKVYDVVLNIKKKTKNFLKHKSFILEEKKKQILYIPKGYAHGFQTMTNDCVLFYLHSENFDKELDKGLYALDEKLEIKWPIKKKILSIKDKNYKKLNFKGI